MVDNGESRKCVEWSYVGHDVKYSIMGRVDFTITIMDQYAIHKRERIYWLLRNVSKPIS